MTMTEIEHHIATAIREGRALTGKDGILTPMIQRAVTAALEGEMAAHLGEDSSSNRRNGYSRKQVKSGAGMLEIATPRDRAGTFEPQLVKKRQTVLTETLDQQLLTLYSLGTSYSDIQAHMADIYGVEVSAATIHAVTDKLLPEISEWRSRPLESVYPIMFMDAIHFKARADGTVQSKALYTLLAINEAGQKDILGLYMSEHEGASFWLSVLSDLQARGVEDILIACVDGLKGFPEAIAAVFPKTTVQLCVIHQIRHSLRYIGSKHQKEFMADLKQVYRAPSLDVAEQKLRELDEKWGKQYPVALKSWHANWGHLSHYFQFSPAIRKLIYTTNAVEGLHRQIRKYTKSKGAFTSEQALLKLVYCAMKHIIRKWSSQPLQNWASIISQLDIAFPKRLLLNGKNN
jgi:putative transposase